MGMSKALQNYKWTLATKYVIDSSILRATDQLERLQESQVFENKI